MYFMREFYHATPCPWGACGADGLRVPNGESRCQPESSPAAAMRVQEARLAKRRGGSGPEEAVFTYHAGGALRWNFPGLCW